MATIANEPGADGLAFSPIWLADDGVAITPDASELFAVSAADSTGDSPVLNIVTNPVPGA